MKLQDENVKYAFFCPKPQRASAAEKSNPLLLITEQEH